VDPLTPALSLRERELTGQYFFPELLRQDKCIVIECGYTIIRMTEFPVVVPGCDQRRLAECLMG